MLFFVRFLVGLLPLAVWIGAGYLAWTWWEGDTYLREDGVLVRYREDWRLWLLIALAAWSLIGRFVTVPLIARPDKPGEELTLKRENGRMIEGDGATLYVEEHGRKTGVPIIMTHGWGLDSRMWRQAIAHMGSDYRLVWWDLPGLGRSRQKDVSLERFASSLKRVIAHTGADKVVLVGHSIGGMTTQTLLRDDPKFFRDRVAAVALFNTTHVAPQNTMVLGGLVRALRKPVIEPVLWLSIILEPLSWLSAWQSYFSGTAHLINRLGSSATITRSQLNAITLLQVKNRPAVQARGDLAMFRWDSLESVAQLDRPLLVIGGGADIVTKKAASEHIAHVAPRGELVVHANANHMGPVDHAETYWRDVKSFLARVGLEADPRSTSRQAAE